ncbi:fungal cellulose binding domain-containing protein [Rutstroemia sp. NJR-2017a WRK4]|nr:fungal cellulose binding domain-containing protein [Rutstroemia sp. NJR-2017a WRK4]
MFFHFANVVPLLAAGYVAALPSYEALSSRQNTGTKYIFSFGDSYTKTVFLISGTKPSARNPIGNPPFPGSTTSGGLNWIDYLVTAYNTTLTLSYNFAYNGATVSADIVPPYKSSVQSLIDQTNIFTSNLAVKPSYAPWTSTNSLFALWFGINDINNSYSNPGEDELQKEIFDVYWKQLDIMYYYGARNFLFLTVPPTILHQRPGNEPYLAFNKSPLVLSYNATAQAQEAAGIAAWNDRLRAAASEFQAERHGTIVTVIDTSVPFNTALNNPKAYGAPSATCYNSDGVSCLWWNNLHPGMAIQNLVAGAVAAAYKGTFF